MSVKSDNPFASVVNSHFEESNETSPLIVVATPVQCSMWDWILSWTCCSESRESADNEATEPDEQSADNEATEPDEQNPYKELMYILETEHSMRYDSDVVFQLLCAIVTSDLPERGKKLDDVLRKLKRCSDSEKILTYIEAAVSAQLNQPRIFCKHGNTCKRHQNKDPNQPCTFIHGTSQKENMMLLYNGQMFCLLKAVQKTRVSHKNKRKVSQ